MNVSLGDDSAIYMFCTQCFYHSPIIASKMLNFECLLCNDGPLISHEISPIAFSQFGYLSCSNVEFAPSFILHVDHLHTSHFHFKFGVFGDVQMKRRIMMDNVFMYHGHNFFMWNFVCNGHRMIISTSIEHELTKRPLESIIVVSDFGY